MKQSTYIMNCIFYSRNIMLHDDNIILLGLLCNYIILPDDYIWQNHFEKYAV